MQKNCANCFHPIAKEFQKEKFTLSHQPADDFLKSQWQNHSKAFWWLIYRWGLAICFCVGVIGSLVEQFNSGKWFIYLTDWGFFFCMSTSLAGAILVSIHHLKPFFLDDFPRLLMIYWALHWSTLVVATLITTIYWSFLYPKDAASAAALYNLWAHGFNSILMVLDHMLVAFPTRLLHFVYPFSLLLIYCLFTIIYYFSGGVDPFGNRYIYPILNWSAPGWAILTVFGCTVIVILWCFILFALYKMRCFIYRKIKHSMLTLKV